MKARAALQVAPRLRTVFLSDLHLGSKNCQAEPLAAFLESIHSRRIYLVGDIVDLWWLSRRRASWGAAQSRVFAALREHAAAGTELVYIPGNHDRPMRHFCGLGLPQLVVRRRAVHTTGDGRRLLVTHGDEHDGITKLGGLHDWLGDKLYDAILTGNRLVNGARTRVGLRYWSLADFLKRKSAAAERYIARYVDACVADARRRGLDGVVCGHIHRPRLAQIGDVVYANDGDWVESLTAIQETHDGTLTLVRWSGKAEPLVSLAPRLVLSAVA